MTLQAAVLLTVTYSAQFSYPLRIRELWLRLLSRGEDAVVPADFVLVLSQLVADDRLGYDDGYVFMSGRMGDIQLRLASEQRAQQKIAELRKVLRFCTFIPWIVGVAVTGSIAMRQARKSDDLDFLVVTQEGRLWLSRALLVFFSSMFGKYRSRTNEHKSGWCFNLWLETTSLALPINKHGVYAAFEVLQADWIYDTALVEQRFLLANAWVKNVIPHAYRRQLARTRSQKKHLGVLSFFPLNLILGFCNFLAYWLQRLHMHSVITREIVQPSAAYFHPRDTRGSIGDRWRSILRTHV